MCVDTSSMREGKIHEEGKGTEREREEVIGIGTVGVSGQYACIGREARRLERA